MNPEPKAAMERLRREVANHMLGMEGETDAFSADILAVCTALEQAMRVVKAAKAIQFSATSVFMDAPPLYSISSTIRARRSVQELQSALAAMEEK